MMTLRFDRGQRPPSVVGRRERADRFGGASEARRRGRRGGRRWCARGRGGGWRVGRRGRSRCGRRRGSRRRRIGPGRGGRLVVAAAAAGSATDFHTELQPSLRLAPFRNGDHVWRRTGRRDAQRTGPSEKGHGLLGLPVDLFVAPVELSEGPAGHRVSTLTGLLVERNGFSDVLGDLLTLFVEPPEAIAGPVVFLGAPPVASLQVRAVARRGRRRQPVGRGSARHRERDPPPPCARGEPPDDSGVRCAPRRPPSFARAREASWLVHEGRVPPSPPARQRTRRQRFSAALRIPWRS